MPSAPRVRLAKPEDLLEIARVSKLAQRAAPENKEETIARHLSAFLSFGGSIFLAIADGDTDISLAAKSGTARGRIGGFALCRLVEPLFFAVDRSVMIDAIFVDPADRRRGLGHELLTAVAKFATENNAAYVYSTPSAADRTLHRFLASLGFAPVAGSRVVATSVLTRRLTRDDPVTQGIAIRSKSRTPARTPIDELIAKRKRARNAELPQLPVA